MTRAAIAAALSTILLATACNAPARFVHLAPDPAKDAACPAEFAALTGLKPLAGTTLTLATPASATLPGQPAPIALPPGTELVRLDDVLDRDEVTALAWAIGRAAWQGCRAALAYRQDFDRQMSGREK